MENHSWPVKGIPRCVCGADSGRADDPCSPCISLLLSWTRSADRRQFVWQLQKFGMAYAVVVLCKLL